MSIIIVHETKKQLFPSQATEISVAMGKIENTSLKEKNPKTTREQLANQAMRKSNCLGLLSL